MDPIRLGDILDGKYEIEGTLGEGAMGVVFSARHRGLGKRVAIKTLRPEIACDQALVGRFEQEARAAGAIGHDNIVEVFDLGTAPGGARYMVMEYLSGLSLAELLTRQPVQPVDRSVAILSQVLSALGAAHRRGIVHRDLKPENIFLVRGQDGQAGRVKLLDFGISKVLDGIADPNIAGDSAFRATRIGTVLGTPLYMSPEQARGMPDIDHRTDLWSVGVVLYEMLVGKPPYDGANYNQIMGAILQGVLVPPRRTNPALPEAIDQFVSKALAQDAAARFQDAAEMRSALIVAAAAQAAPVAPPSAPPPAGLADSATGLAAAASGRSAEQEAAMLSALDRLGSGAVAPPGVAASAVSAPAAAAAVSAPAAAAVSAPAAAAVSAPAAAAPPGNDAFAPPESEEAPLSLDLSVAAPELAPRLAARDAEVRRSAERKAQATPAPAPAPRASAAPVAPRSPGTATAVRGPLITGGGVVKLLLVVAVLGAGGFGAYRYATKGYLLSPPGPPAVSLTLQVAPPEADVLIDELITDKRIVELQPGHPRTLRVMATGRVAVDQTLTAPADGAARKPLAIYLRHQLPLLTRGLAPVRADAGANASATTDAAIEAALAKLTRVAGCVGPAAEALRDTRDAYVGPVHGRASSIRPGHIPKIVPLPVDVLTACHTVAQSAPGSPPALPAIDPDLGAMVDAVDQLRTGLDEVGKYYANERYRNDHMHWGRKMHPIILHQLEQVGTVLDRLTAATADLRAFWLERELDRVGEVEGKGAHYLLRRLALMSQLWVGAVVRGADDPQRAAASAALAGAYSDASDYLAAHPTEAQAVDGAGIFLTSCKPLVELSKGAADPARALELGNAAVTNFDAMVL